ncbi:suppressor APC domain-containing protein 1 [Corythoichthys intestinalis]|uniref:suppressor APC domain-containing protein 1 n=1 Tax=Corythoichthys intestinalis TaxID=161448 RepID=UPI0025A5ED55|nr:suppressor APC domain-containing protein 1 [Corythoichthys intestinalis]XP_061809439.1 suppressor APC domain-containing protein 1-like [Nerophis lumbriciformis]
MDASCSYTVVFIPLRSGLGSLDALRFYLWIKHLKDLEKEKDILYCGLEILEQARLWYRHRLAKNRTKQGDADTQSRVDSCNERSRIHYVNATLASVMTDSNISRNSAIESALRWQHTLLTQEVSHKNRQISALEMEKDALLERLYDV